MGCGCPWGQHARHDVEARDRLGRLVAVTQPVVVVEVVHVRVDAHDHREVAHRESVGVLDHVLVLEVSQCAGADARHSCSMCGDNLKKN